MAAITGVAGFTTSGAALAGVGDIASGIWNKSIVNTIGVFTCKMGGPNNTTVFLPVIDFIGAQLFDILTIGIYAVLSAAATTNCTVNLYGSFTTSSGDAILIDDDIFSGDIGATAKFHGVDISDFPYPYYFLGLVSTGNNANKEATIKITAPLVWAPSIGVQG